VVVLYVLGFALIEIWLDEGIQMTASSGMKVSSAIGVGLVAVALLFAAGNHGSVAPTTQPTAKLVPRPTANGDGKYTVHVAVSYTSSTGPANNTSTFAMINSTIYHFPPLKAASEGSPIYAASISEDVLWSEPPNVRVAIRAPGKAVTCVIRISGVAVDTKLKKNIMNRVTCKTPAAYAPGE
jgi:hypothetical protein